MSRTNEPARANGAESSPRPRVAHPDLDQTSDDTDRGWGEHLDQEAHEQWLKDQRPPHWD